MLVSFLCVDRQNSRWSRTKPGLKKYSSKQSRLKNAYKKTNTLVSLHVTSAIAVGRFHSFS